MVIKYDEIEMKGELFISKKTRMEYIRSNKYDTLILFVTCATKIEIKKSKV